MKGGGTMTKLLTFLQGKKTYILTALGLIYALSGYLTGNLDAQTALALVYSSGVISTLRAAISK